MSCIYGCQKDGTPCPRPHTCHKKKKKKKKKQNKKEKAKTERQEERSTGNCYGMLDVVNDVAWVLIGVALVAGLAGWLAQFFRG